MTFKSPLWMPAAFVLSGMNVVAGGYAIAAGEPMHAGVHAALAVVFGFWADRRRRAERDEPEPRLDAVEAEIGNLRAELLETQERMDFVERLLARDADSHRIGPDR